MVRTFFFTIVLLLISLHSNAQYVVKNDYVEALVESGLVTITNPEFSNLQSSYSFRQKSYLTVKIGSDTFYTNNPNANIPITPNYLLNAKTTVNADTIETVWQPAGANAFEIIQDVYPVEFPIVGSGQIVFRFRMRNHSKAPLTAAAQYLLDLYLSKPGWGNDGPPVTTRFGYMEHQWGTFTNNIPPYFIATLHSITQDTFPGDIVSSGYMNDSLAPEPMGLKQPSLFAFVGWTNELYQTWGIPAPADQGPIDGDNALLFQWPASSTIDSGRTVELGSFSCGSAPCSNICTTGGGLRELVLHPEHIVWNGKEYVPNRFPVEAIVWNASTTANDSSATGTQTITNESTGLQSGPITITAPSPVLNNGYVQSHSMQPQVIIDRNSSSISWVDTVHQTTLASCQGDSEYDLSLSVMGSGVGPNLCLGPSSCPILVDCQGFSNDLPISQILNQAGSFDGSQCNVRSTSLVAFDTGFERIPVVSVTMKSDTNMKLTLAPSIPGADSVFYTVSVLDSMQNGSATVVITDSLGNVKNEFYPYCTIPDTKWPKFNPILCIKAPCPYEITDDQPWDRGLDTINFNNLVNVKIDLLSQIHGMHQVQFTAVPIDSLQPFSFCISAIDLAGHTFDTCFGTVASVASEVPTPIDLKVIPNPVSNVATILVTGTPTASIEIFDVLGHEISHFIVSRTYDWQTSPLPAGTYIVRATAGDLVVAKRVLKE